MELFAPPWACVILAGFLLFSAFDATKVSSGSATLMPSERTAVPEPLPLQEAPSVAPRSPRVVKLIPAHGDYLVDAAKVKELRVTFDQAMMTSNVGVMQRSATFPKLDETKPWYWVDDKTLVLQVTLTPSTRYEMSLNSLSRLNFRNQAGLPLAPHFWTIETHAVDRAVSAERKIANLKALDEVFRFLESKYSYYAKRKVDWAALRTSHEPRIINAPDQKTWGYAVASMLSAAQDEHLYLRLPEGGGIPSTHVQRSSFFHINHVVPLLETHKKLNDDSFVGKTADNIGYLSIATWQDKVDVEKLKSALMSLVGTKAIILDQRANTGGNELNGREIAKYFIQGKPVYAQHQIRLAKGQKGLSPLMKRTIQGVSKKEFQSMPVILLNSEAVMSSAEAFALMMAQAPNCRIVGQKTRGSSGNPKPFPLSNGLTLMLPSWLALRADGTCFEGEGIFPDVRVSLSFADFLRGDPILERALGLLRAELK